MDRTGDCRDVRGRAGRLAAGAAEGLAARLVSACAGLVRQPVAAAFDGLLSGRPQPDGKVPLFLVRGVLLPLAGNDGRLAAAHLALGWKQILDREASDRLGRELDLVLGRSGARPVRADVFAA